jgi:O-acetyl-ADP-ribose deacetylase (regulator of RNase III)
MNTITGNILDIHVGIICHQVSAQYVMGAGLALQIARKWPVVKRAYLEERPILGAMQIVNVAHDLWVANLVGQEKIGRGEVQTNYPAFTNSIKAAARIARISEKKIYFPYMMGCGLAGGDWEIVSEIISRCSPDAIIVRLSDTRAPRTLRSKEVIKRDQQA